MWSSEDNVRLLALTFCLAESGSLLMVLLFCLFLTSGQATLLLWLSSSVGMLGYELQDPTCSFLMLVSGMELRLSGLPGKCFY